jgi:hypothetical protein
MSDKEISHVIIYHSEREYWQFEEPGESSGMQAQRKPDLPCLYKRIHQRSAVARGKKIQNAVIPFVSTCIYSVRWC